MVDEVLRKRVEQRRIGGRIGQPHVVLRLDQAAAEEVLPVSVDERASEVGVVGRRHPVSESAAGIDVGRDRAGLAAEHGGLVNALWPRRLRLAAEVVDPVLARL